MKQRVCEDERVPGRSHLLLMVMILPFSLLLFKAPAAAQEAQSPAAPAMQAEAPEKKVPVPAAAYPRFPALPPSRACVVEDVKGKFWRLRNLYEQPPGKATASLKEKPSQYLYFGYVGIYSEVKIAQRLATRNLFFKQFRRKEGEPLLQYVVGEGGFIYFYKDGNVVDTQRCLMVMQDHGGFTEGEILLMNPPKPAGEVVDVRWLKQFFTFATMQLPKPKEAKP